MSPFKKKVTEESAARQFVSVKLQEGIDFWATNYAALRDSFGDKFIIQDQSMGNVDLFLAKIALHTASLKNLFPPEQADRIRGWILKTLDTMEYGDYGRYEIEEYEGVYYKSVKLVENPVSAIAVRLLHKWLGANIADFGYEFGGKRTGTIGPLQSMLVTMIVSEGVGWKIIKDNLDIIEG